MSGPVPSGWGGWLGWAAALIIGVGTVLVNWRKGQIDQSTMILGRWKEMVDQHAEDIKELRDELRKERETNTVLRASLNEARDEIAALKLRINEIEQRHTAERQGYLAQILQLNRMIADLNPAHAVVPVPASGTQDDTGNRPPPAGKDEP